MLDSCLQVATAASMLQGHFSGCEDGQLPFSSPFNSQLPLVGHKKILENNFSVHSISQLSNKDYEGNFG